MFGSNGGTWKQPYTSYAPTYRVSLIPQFEEPTDYAKYLEYGLTAAEGFATYSESAQWNKLGKGMGIVVSGYSLAQASAHYSAGKTFEGEQAVFSATAAIAGGLGAAKYVPDVFKPYAFILGGALSGFGAEKLYEQVIPPPMEKVFGLYPYNTSTAPIEYSKSHVAPIPQVSNLPLPPLNYSEQQLFKFGD